MRNSERISIDRASIIRVGRVIVINVSYRGSSTLRCPGQRGEWAPDECSSEPASLPAVITRISQKTLIT